MRTVFALSTLALTTALNAATADLPPPFEATYRVENKNLTLGEVTISLRYEGDNYIYEKRTHTVGLLSLFRNDEITEISRGIIRGQSILPKNYNYTHEKGKKLKSSLTATINNGSVKGAYRDRKFEFNASKEILDRASVELALMRDSNAQLDNLNYDIVDKGKPARYKFLSDGTKSISSPAGEFQCIEYHVDRDTNNRATSFCLAPELNFLPIYAAHDEKGTLLDMHLLRYTLHPMPSSMSGSVIAKPNGQPKDAIASAN